MRADGSRNPELAKTSGVQAVSRFANDTARMALLIRRHAVEMTAASGASHIGSVLSMADILAVLYGSFLRVDPERPAHPDRDRFILSKGHGACGLYAALALRGFFSTDELSSHYAAGSRLMGHASHAVPGVEFSTGSLGHGLPVGAGLAWDARRAAAERRQFVLMSDGECDEGTTWETALFAAHHGLGNLAAIIDYNKIQSLRSTHDTLDLEPFADKWRAFGWQVTEVDGHDHGALATAFARFDGTGDKPLCVIAHTTKGKGVSFMEGQVLWHYRSPQGQELADALAELAE